MKVHALAYAVVHNGVPCPKYYKYGAIYYSLLATLGDDQSRILSH